MRLTSRVASEPVLNELSPIASENGNGVRQWGIATGDRQRSSPPVPFG